MKRKYLFFIFALLVCFVPACKVKADDKFIFYISCDYTYDKGLHFENNGANVDDITIHATEVKEKGLFKNGYQELQFSLPGESDSVTSSSTKGKFGKKISGKTIDFLTYVDRDNKECPLVMFVDKNNKVYFSNNTVSLSSDVKTVFKLKNTKKLDYLYYLNELITPVNQQIKWDRNTCPVYVYLGVASDGIAYTTAVNVGNSGTIEEVLNEHDFTLTLGTIMGYEANGYMPLDYRTMYSDYYKKCSSDYGKTWSKRTDIVADNCIKSFLDVNFNFEDLIGELEEWYNTYILPLNGDVSGINSNEDAGQYYGIVNLVMEYETQASLILEEKSNENINPDALCPDVRDEYLENKEQFEYYSNRYMTIITDAKDLQKKLADRMSELADAGVVTEEQAQMYEELAEKIEKAYDLYSKSLSIARAKMSISLDFSEADGCALFSEDFTDFLKDVMWYVKLGAIILAIVLSMADYIKAVAGSDDKSMNAANKRFMTRFILVIVLFLVPVLIEFTLSIFNINYSNDGITSVQCLYGNEK